MLTLTFLGVGSAYAKSNFQSNTLIEAWAAGPEKQDAPDDTLLVDFGTTGPLALYQLKNKPGFSYLDRDGSIDYTAIRRIIITHLHSDHIGGLEELARMNAHHHVDPANNRRFKPQLISTSDVLEDLWHHSLKGGLGTLAGRNAELGDYFNLLQLRSGHDRDRDRLTVLNRYEVSLFPTDHIRIRQRYDWPSHGLLIADRASCDTVMFSGDTVFDPECMGEMMAASRINFHEVQLEDQPGPVHATLSELRTLPEAVRKKTILYHYGDAWDSGAYEFVSAEFAGFAVPHHRYTLFD